MILAVIGGAIGELNNYVTTQDLTAFGQYGVYLKALLTGTPVLVLAIWIYNVWMYVRQNRIAAVKQLAEQYDTTKLVQTIALFTGMIGPIVAFLPQYKEIGALVVVIGTALAKEIQNVLTGQDITALSGQTTATTAPSGQTTATQTPTTASALVTSTTTQAVGTYQGWTVKLVNGWMQILPPANLASTVGMTSYNVIGYSLSSILDMSKPYIDQAITWLNTPKQTPVIVPPAPIQS
jgi:hypothetical protein